MADGVSRSKVLSTAIGERQETASDAVGGSNLRKDDGLL